MQGVKTLVECEWGIKFLDRMFVKDSPLYQLHTLAWSRVHCSLLSLVRNVNNFTGTDESLMMVRSLLYLKDVHMTKHDTKTLVSALECVNNNIPLDFQ